MDTQSKILDIAMNLTRIGNWAADGFLMRQKRIRQFLNETSQELASLKPDQFSNHFKKTFERFLVDYYQLEKDAAKKPGNELEWAEKMMTWGNILTHRAKLVAS